METIQITKLRVWFLNEADTCRKLVVPKFQAAGWDTNPHSIAEQCRIVAELDALQAEVDARKRLQTESGQCPHPTLDVLRHAMLDRAFKGKL